jgi:hypothetical protein
MRQLGRSAAVLLVAAAAMLAAACSTHQVPAISTASLDLARAYRSYTVWWAGRDVDGVPLTQATTPLDFYSAVGFQMFYGNCGSRGPLHDNGCRLPLKITTNIYSPHSDASFGPQRWIMLHGVPAVVYHGGDDIEVYTDKMDVDIIADTPRRAMDAANALKPFNRGVSPEDPAFPQPYYTPNPPQALLNAIATGATGATGTTGDLSPPEGLEPTTSAQTGG